MSRDINPFGLRMPLKLRAQVEAAAKANGRSVNSEICARLQESFDMDSESGEESSAADEMLALLRETINRLPGEVADALAARMKGAGSNPTTNRPQT